MRLDRDWYRKTVTRKLAEVAFWKQVLRAQATNPYIEPHDLDPLREKIRFLQSALYVLRCDLKGRLTYGASSQQDALPA